MAVPPLRIAVSGCVHGSLDQLYSKLAQDEAKHGFHCDLLLCTGDFQALRDRIDLEVMTCPEKYRTMGDFWKYYVGMAEAPVLTVVIGGNHEAVGYMQEMKLGGWLAPNIFYIGEAGIVRAGSLRIAGLSGIYREHDYHKGPVTLPLTPARLKESYAVKSSSVDKLKRVGGPVDVFMTHDWPRGIAASGDAEELLMKKPWLRGELGTMGNPHSRSIADRLSPQYWVASHMHVRWDAELPGTHFRAMDKCLPSRSFLSYITDISGSVGTPMMDKGWATEVLGREVTEDLRYPEFGMIEMERPHCYARDSEWRVNPQAFNGNC